MRVMIDMDISTVHHDLVRVAEQRRNLFERDALGLREEEVRPSGAEDADDDEYQVKFPSDILESGCCRLEVDQIGQGDGGHGQAEALGAEVVGEELAVEDYAGDIDAKGIAAYE